MLNAVGAELFHLEDRHKLMLPELAPGGSFTATKHFKIEYVRIELNGFLSIVNFNDDMITAVYLNRHFDTP
jgi:hypothetical protein